MYIKELSKGIKIKGFKKNSLTWLCQCDPFVYMFRIEPGKYCDKNWQYYTLEIGIYSSDVFALCWGKVPKGKSVKNTDCCLRGSISDFFQENGDIEFYEDVDVKELQERINFLIEKDIIPFFNKIKSFEKLYRIMLFYEEKAIQQELHQIYIACIEYIMNKKNDALIRLEKINNQVWKKKAQEVIMRMTNKQLSAENN
ncbi:MULTISPECIES: DUF4304 domain-containing protein [Bacteroidales]|jgi:hypothetical protein|uniref:DUF4304 domain-containing protein n=5 Tax=Bacteroidales TaxID=171549 RepID=A0A1C7GX13_9BACE|nr:MULTISPECIES: DUF4304 domain-containing protein [Bacteroidales]NPE39763.1 DUF4304 domain-containing protein [Prevotella sp. PCJ2]ANU56799.1 hypothetical protein A4V03_03745 [Bacteroides caecimuris]ANU58196.1 hypothetical protein A4V03_11985 [Bacteroides caecimuris]ANU62876.1 hypothetical protein A4V02_03490 [Muribaculum intestinale]ASB36624.1 hypothetical protein ADH68_00530 [Muribaculum intestinale]